MFEDFDYAQYERLLAGLVDRHENLCFGEAQDGSLPDAYYLLRHDVDFCPEAALGMAELEARNGVRATYFLLFSSPFYNLLDVEHRSFPRRLVELGHEVGLHYDVSAYEATGVPDLSEVLLAEAALLGTMSGRQVSSIAAHNPSLHGQDPFGTSERFVNAYDHAFTVDTVYLSDSCGAWRNDAVRMLATPPYPPRIQLLVHPVFWSATHRHRVAALEAVGECRRSSLAGWIARTQDIWGHHDGVREHERRQPRFDVPPSALSPRNGAPRLPPGPRSQGVPSD